MISLPTFRVACLLLVLLPGCGAAAEAGCPSTAGSPCAQASVLRGVRPPARVLVVPLLHKGEDSAENERWPEYPAAGIARFYRGRFGARVEWLRDVRQWADYHRQVEGLLQRSASFDRILFIGHGGFDGPILDGAVVRAGFKVEGGGDTLFRAVEAQPGLQRSVTITYAEARNPAFSDYLAGHWRELVGPDGDPVGELRALEARLQPLHPACASHCLSQPGGGEGGRVAACEWVCRDPLFRAESVEEAAPERFLHFARGLRELLAEGGLIVFGACNPGSLAREGRYPWETDGVLVHSALAGGPHPSYVHLLAAATGRAVAGPIGRIGADEMVALVARLETRGGHRRLRVVVPAAGTGIP